MKPEIEDTDVIIRRAANGWIVFSGSEYEEDHFIVTVYEEGETEWGEHEALIGLFREHFDAYTQSKKMGGIKLEVRKKGYTFEEDEEEDSMFAGLSSINLLNRLDGRTKGGYVENYDDLHLELKTLDGYAQIDNEEE